MFVRGQLTWSITRGSPRTWGSSHVLGIASAILQLACSKGGRRFPRETSGTVGIQSSHVEAKSLMFPDNVLLQRALFPKCYDAQLATSASARSAWQRRPRRKVSAWPPRRDRPAEEVQAVAAVVSHVSTRLATSPSCEPCSEPTCSDAEMAAIKARRCARLASQDGQRHAQRPPRLSSEMHGTRRKRNGKSG